MEINNEIPKVIHYCWFGGNPLPKSALRCIASWKKYFPGYEIKRWDESNFDVNSIPYTREAYKHKLYAFVSDYARFWILQREGGIYFDTDVEVIKPMDEIISKGPYMGIEEGKQINVGLGMASFSNIPFLKEIIEFYKTNSLYREDGSINYDTVVVYTTKILEEHGWTGKESHIAEFNIFPKEYFCPMDYKSGKLTITPNTYSIHHYSATWIPFYQKFYKNFKSLFGERAAQYFSKMFKNLNKMFKNLKM